MNATGAVSASSIVIIAVKAISFWLVLTLVGSWASPWISSFIMALGTKKGFYKEPSIHLCVALGLAFLVSGIAEMYFGLAMIIGAYSLGLALSGTTLFEEVEEPIRKINGFVVPIFFTVVGMQVNLQSIFGSDQLTNTLLFALVLTIFGIISKLLVLVSLHYLLVSIKKFVGNWRRYDAERRSCFNNRWNWFGYWCHRCNNIWSDNSNDNSYYNFGTNITKSSI